MRGCAHGLVPDRIRHARVPLDPARVRGGGDSALGPRPVRGRDRRGRDGHIRRPSGSARVPDRDTFGVVAATVVEHRKSTSYSPMTVLTAFSVRADLESSDGRPSSGLGRTRALHIGRLRRARRVRYNRCFRTAHAGRRGLSSDAYRVERGDAGCGGSPPAADGAGRCLLRDAAGRLGSGALRRSRRVWRSGALGQLGVEGYLGGDTMMFSFFACVGVALLSLGAAGCGESAEAPPETSSLGRSCSSQDDCSEGLCQLGPGPCVSTCVLACSGDGDCSSAYPTCELGGLRRAVRGR